VRSWRKTLGDVAVVARGLIDGGQIIVRCAIQDCGGSAAAAVSVLQTKIAANRSG